MNPLNIASVSITIFQIHYYFNCNKMIFIITLNEDTVNTALSHRTNSEENTDG